MVTYFWVVTVYCGHLFLGGYCLLWSPVFGWLLYIVVTCLQVEQSHVSSIGLKSVRNFVDFREIEPGCCNKRPLPNRAVLERKEYMLPPCQFLLYSSNIIVTEETSRLSHSDTKKLDHFISCNLIWANNGNKRPNLMRYKILYQRSLPSVTYTHLIILIRKELFT